MTDRRAKPQFCQCDSRRMWLHGQCGGRGAGARAGFPEEGHLDHSLEAEPGGHQLEGGTRVQRDPRVVVCELPARVTSCLSCSVGNSHLCDLGVRLSTPQCWSQLPRPGQDDWPAEMGPLLPLPFPASAWYSPLQPGMLVCSQPWEFAATPVSGGPSEPSSCAAWQCPSLVVAQLLGRLCSSLHGSWSVTPGRDLCPASVAPPGPTPAEPHECPRPGTGASLPCQPLLQERRVAMSLQGSLSHSLRQGGLCPRWPGARGDITPPALCSSLPTSRDTPPPPILCKDCSSLTLPKPSPAPQSFLVQATEGSAVPEPGFGAAARLQVRSSHNPWPPL